MGTNESGFLDVYIRGVTAVACGFDNGADVLPVILTRTTTTSWVHVDVSATDFASSLWCIAVDEYENLIVGGIRGAGGPFARAFISLHSSSVESADLVLPGPKELGGVNDILIAADGS